jgi:hypothetical protein
LEDHKLPPQALFNLRTSSVPKPKILVEVLGLQARNPVHVRVHGLHHPQCVLTIIKGGIYTIPHPFRPQLNRNNMIRNLSKYIIKYRWREEEIWKKESKENISNEVAITAHKIWIRSISEIQFNTKSNFNLSVDTTNRELQGIFVLLVLTRISIWHKTMEEFHFLMIIFSIKMRRNMVVIWSSKIKISQ